MKSAYDVVVIGAGPAGLATARELAQRRIDYVVLERGIRIGHTWENLYASLVLHTGKHLSALPGMPFPSSTSLFPSRLEFLQYLDRYAEHFDLTVTTGARVVNAARAGDRWRLETSEGPAWTARAVVVATGIVSNPHIPEVARRHDFAGQFLHSVDYRRPDEFRSQRVLVVGVGNSAGEIGAELAHAGALVTIAVRSGARVVPRQLLGVPIQYFAVVLGVLPRDAQRAIAQTISRASELARGATPLPRPTDRKCSDVPLIGFHLIEAVRAKTIRLKGAIARFTKHGAAFADGTEEPFDAIILATGYRAAIGLLGNQIEVDECGFARRRDRVVSCDQSDLYFVGHNYDTRGALRNIWRDARLTARLIERGSDGSWGNRSRLWKLFESAGAVTAPKAQSPPPPVVTAPPERDRSRT